MALAMVQAAAVDVAGGDAADAVDAVDAADAADAVDVSFFSSFRCSSSCCRCRCLSFA